jgi:hypothetical protein
MTPAAHAASHGPVLKGQEISAPATLKGQTGACSCMEQWYTIGLRAGNAVISGRLSKCDDQGRPYCFMVVSLIRGNNVLASASVQCPSNKAHCNRAWTIRHHAAARAVYYLQVKGEVGLIMDYTLRPATGMYPLHCGKYC